jgi:hypothetical protein
MDRKFKLTTSSVKQRCHPPEPGAVNGRGTPTSERWYWDTEDKGFFLVVRKDSAT